MIAKTMAEVLAGHWSASTHSDRKPFVDKCDGCGAVIMTWGEGGDMPALLVAHQAAALSAAGFGLVADAVVIHVAHDTEAHARSFNKGYEAAVTQGLADDPTVADDWLQAKLREAKAEALEEAAGVLDEDQYDCYDPYYADWLRARAAAVRDEE